MAGPAKEDVPMTQRIIFAVSLVLGSMMSIAVGRAEDKQNIQWLYHACKNRDDNFNYLLCVGYVSGIGDLMHVNGGAPHRDTGWDDRLCGDPSYGAQVQAFVNWAEKHPNLWQYPRPFGVVTALREAWACR
jgi:hypothetical protein